MTNQHTLFPHVQEYYADLCTRLESAQEKISMVFLSLDDGTWARRIAGILSARAAAGVPVHLMVDAFGELTDNLPHCFRNRRLLADLRRAGVQVDVFQSRSNGLSLLNRMHCKVTAIDTHTAYLGGSNLGDYYTTWSDSNLRVEGQLGQAFHDLVDYLGSFMRRKGPSTHPDPLSIWAASDRIRLTLPGRLYDIRSALLELICSADRSIHIRSWYFLPDAELLNLLCEQALRGIRVNVLLSDKTRVRPIDFANHVHVHRLVAAGGQVYRYRPGYMHAKVAWNDGGTSFSARPTSTLIPCTGILSPACKYGMTLCVPICFGPLKPTSRSASPRRSSLITGGRSQGRRSPTPAQ